MPERAGVEERGQCIMHRLDGDEFVRCGRAAKAGGYCWVDDQRPEVLERRRTARVEGQARRVATYRARREARLRVSERTQ